MMPMTSRRIALAAASLALVVAEGCSKPGGVQCTTGVYCPPGWQCAAKEATCIQGQCGNNITDPGEACDDGNVIDGDGCSADCKSDESCGNGIVDTAAGERCDKKIDPRCSDDCSRIIGCGNSQPDPGEQCDTGGLDSISCDADCSYTRCGDGHTNPSAVRQEQCDGGDPDHPDPPDPAAHANGQSATCNPDCTTSVCGDEFINKLAGEECDDGPGANGDSLRCTSECKNNVCGDGHKWEGQEECDEGAANSDTGACTKQCKTNRCGDGHKWEGQEECDEGAANSDTGACTKQCKTNVCGDGHRWTEQEECDQGSANSDTGACTSQCMTNRCGDGHQNKTIVNGRMVEGCDEGAANSDTGACTTQCMKAGCGDGHTWAGNEECDQGAANSDTGACTTRCMNAGCGDGHTWAGHEECDEGAANSDTGACTTHCMNHRCGDGYTWEGHEECDEGAANSDTGACTTQCKKNVCGDGHQNMTIVNGRMVEGCDEGAANSDTGACTTQCVKAGCGDGHTWAGREECDEGAANSDTGACTTHCMNHRCGDGYTFEGQEECDAGPNAPTACDYGVQSCTLCIGCKSTTVTGTFCGDGIVQVGTAQQVLEQCDAARSFACLTCGARTDSDACKTRSVAPASGTITVVGCGADSCTDLVGTTFTLIGKTFEFVDESSPSKGIGVNIHEATTPAGVAATIVAGINNNCNGVVSAWQISDDSPVAQVQHNTTGKVGNGPIVITAPGATAGLTTTGLISGAGCALFEDCEKNEDCVTHVCEGNYCTMRCVPPPGAGCVSGKCVFVREWGGQYCVKG